MRVSSRMLAVVVAAGSMLPAAWPATADTVPRALAMDSFARIVADPAHGQLFLSPGRSGSAVTVTDLDGNRTGTVAGLSGATGMALTPDGSSLWVALATGDALARVDTATLDVAQTVALPAGTCPGDVTVVGDRVVYGYSCNTYGGSGSYGGIGTVDATSGAVLGTDTTGAFYEPIVVPGPAGQVYAGDGGLSPTTLYLYSVTGAAPAKVTARRDTGSNLRELASSPDGSLVVQASGWPYQHNVYSAPDLGNAGVYPSDTYPNAVAWSADGSVVAAGTDSAYEPDVRLYATGGSQPLRTVDFGNGVYLADRGLALSADGSTTWAVTTDVYGENVAVRQLSLQAPTATNLTLAADPSAAYSGTTTSVGGWLSSGGEGLPAATLTVTRIAGGVESALPAVQTRDDGTYVFQDTLPSTVESLRYRVSFAGDAQHGPVTTETTVTVWSTVPGLTLELTEQSTASANVYGTVRLGYSGNDSPAGVTVHVRRQGDGVSTALPDLVTDAFGSAKFTDSVPAGSTTTYVVSVDATGVHPAISQSDTITVSAPQPAPTTLTLSASPKAVLVGTPVSLSGTLSAGTAAVGGREVVVTRSGCSSAPGIETEVIGNTVTAADGRWSLADDYPWPGSCGYRAEWAGDATYAASSSPKVTVDVAKRTTTLTVSALRGSGRDKKTVTVTATLGATYANRTVTITAIPSGGSTVVLATGTVDGNGRLVATYQARTTATYTATFDGDSHYLPATATTTL